MAPAELADGSSDEAEPEPEGDDDWDASLARAPSRARSRPAHVLEGSDEADDSDDEDENNDEDDFDDDTDFKARKPALSKKNEKTIGQQMPATTGRAPPERAARKRAGEMKEQQDVEELGLDKDEDEDKERASDSDDDDERKSKKQQANPFDAASVPPPEAYDADKIDQVLDHKRKEDSDIEDWAGCQLLIKWRGLSHLWNSWESIATLRQLDGYKRVENYMLKIDRREKQRECKTSEDREAEDVELQMERDLQAQWTEVERVVAQEYDEEGEPRFLVKWRGLPYEQATWEYLTDRFLDLESANREIIRFQVSGQDGVSWPESIFFIDTYVYIVCAALMMQERERRLKTVTSKSVEVQRRWAQREGVDILDRQPEFLKGGELRDYQLEGLNWLIHSWKQNNNCVLADEMGLGKTVQCAAMLGWLVETMQVLGPFLIVVPLSTVPIWFRELAKWVPSLNTVLYVGNQYSREIVRNYELFQGGVKGSQKRVRFDVLVTTYEVFLKDASLLQSISWAYFICDEAHRLKNSEGQMHKEMREAQAGNKLLVTGTPLQNNLRELWAILNFLHPEKFQDCDDFEERHSENMSSQSGLNVLHKELGPHLLRRTVKDVEKSLPPKRERVLRIAMSPLQRQYYKWILQRNVSALNKGAHGSGQVSLLNVVMELKKCCNHPFLFESAEASYADDSGGVDSLVRSSAKFALLDKLLHRLYQENHRCLIFTQMVRMLDILAEYLKGRKFKFQRLDGSQPAHMRDHAVDHFNAPGSDDFCFILSTRAGGLGLNLATADTVIIFDSDWNPKSDMQAMSRAHRIGQTETVNIYRFITRDSVEEDILERAKQKMVLDHLVIQGMDTSGKSVVGGKSGNKKKSMFSGEELSKVLRFGAEDLFKLGNEEAGDVDADVKGQEVCTDQDLDNILERADQNAPAEDEHQAQGNDGLFNQFKVASFDQEEDDATFWSRLLGEPVDEDVQVAEENEDPWRDPPTRRANEHAKGSMKEPGQSIKENVQAQTKQQAPQKGKKAKKQGTTSKSSGTPLENALVKITSWPESNQEPLSRTDAARFARAAKQYRRSSVDSMRTEVQGQLAGATDDELRSLYDCMIEACKQVVNEASRKKLDVREQVVDFFGSSVKAAEHLNRHRELEELAQRAQRCRSVSEFTVERGAQMRAPTWGKEHKWGQRQDAMLLLGVHRHGLGNWEAVAKDIDLNLWDKIKVGEATSGAKTEQVEQRATQLLRKLREVNEGSDEQMKKESKATNAAKTNASGNNGTSSRQQERAAWKDEKESGKRADAPTNSSLEISTKKRKRKAESDPHSMATGKARTKAEAKANAGENMDDLDQSERQRRSQMLSDQQMRTRMEHVRPQLDQFAKLRRNKSIGRDERLQQSQELIRRIGQQVSLVAAKHAEGGGDMSYAERVCWTVVKGEIGFDSAEKLQMAYSKLREREEQKQQQHEGDKIGHNN